MAGASSAIPQRWPVEYPESDGKPMAETDVHWVETVDARHILGEHFAHDQNVYVASDLLIYFEEGNPAAAVAPDVFVIKGVPMKQRRIYKVWEEGQVPDFALEISSRSTRLEDRRTKLSIYRKLGVHEYFLWDPLTEYLRPPLQGLRLDGGEYLPIPREPDGSLYSESLNLRLRNEGERLRFIDPVSNEPLPTLRERAAREAEGRLEAEEGQRKEAAARRKEAAARRKEAAARQHAESAREEAERRVGELEAELTRLRAALRSE